MTEGDPVEVCLNLTNLPIGSLTEDLIVNITASGGSAGAS